MLHLTARPVAVLHLIAHFHSTETRAWVRQTLNRAPEGPQTLPFNCVRMTRQKQPHSGEKNVSKRRVVHLRDC